jgi:hypothetical protein
MAFFFTSFRSLLKWCVLNETFHGLSKMSLPSQTPISLFVSFLRLGMYHCLKYVRDMYFLFPLSYLIFFSLQYELHACKDFFLSYTPLYFKCLESHLTHSKSLQIIPWIN